MTSVCQKTQGVDNLFLIAHSVDEALVGSEIRTANGSNLSAVLARSGVASDADAERESSRLFICWRNAANKSEPRLDVGRPGVLGSGQGGCSR